MALVYKLISVVVLLSAETCQFSGIPSNRFGAFDFMELESMAYEVEIASAPISELQLQEKTEQEGDKEEDGVLSMPVVSKHGQLYSCSLPSLAHITEMKETETESSVDTLPNITTLLKPLADQDCLIKTVGWWTYEYCHNHFIRQYHMEAGRIVGDTKYLGFYENETIWDQKHITRVKGLMESLKDNLDGSQARAYHSIYFVNGTECDITHQPRTTKVEMFCTLEGIDKLVEVKEESTCNYTLAIQTPLLCQHPMMLPLGKLAHSHTLSCTPVVSQLDYEDYLLKQELIRQQKEKWSVLQGSSDDSSDMSSQLMKESLFTTDHKLLKKLVMSSITQLAEIAYNAGEFDEKELESEVISDNDEEVGPSSLKNDGFTSKHLVKDRSSESKVQENEKSEQTGEEHEEMDEDSKVSDKMKKMANDVKNTGRDSALESLLSNLAVTAEYIESLDSDTDTHSADDDRNVDKELFETGEPEEGYAESHNDKHKPSSSGDISVNGPRPPPLDDARKTSKSRPNDENAAEEGKGEGVYSSSEILAAMMETNEDEEEEFELNEELVREMEQHLEETLSKKLDTKDITVKIITLPDEDDNIMDDVEERRRVGGEEGVSHDGDDSDLSDVISRLLDSLLNGEEPESEDKQRQSKLETEYDHVWGRDQNDRRKSGR